MEFSLETGYGPKAGLDQVCSGRVFMVAASTVANYNYLAAMFPVDEQGVQRLHATINSARAAALANGGDLILIAEGHTESVTGAAGIALSVAGVEYKGLGVGNTRPTLTIASTDNSGTITMSANNVKLTNVVLVGNDDALTNALVVTGDNCYIDIETHDTSSAVEMATIVRLDTADNCYLKLKHNGFAGGDAMVSAVRVDDCDNVFIDVHFYGKVTTAVVEMVDAASTNVYVKGYMYVSGTTSGAKDVVDTVTGSTWFGEVLDGSAGAAFSGGSAASWASDDASAIASNVGAQTATSVYVPGTTNPVMGYVKGTSDLQEKVAKSAAAAVMVNGDTLFTIAGGPIQILALVSICESANDATASTLQYQAVPTSGSAQTISAASASLANAAAGASVTLAGTALTTAALLNANGPNLIANPGAIVAPAGTLKVVIAVGSTTGTWRHYLRYKPLATGVTVS